MEKDNDKPQGYYDEINYPTAKKDDLLQFLHEYDVSVYSNSDKDFDYLDDDSLVLVVKNPYCEKNMDIELAGEFSLFFAGWHAHYASYEYDYDMMKKDIMNFLNGKIAALVVYNHLGWLGSTVYTGDAIGETNPVQLLREKFNDEAIISQLRHAGGQGQVKLIYWNPADSISLDVTAEDIAKNKKTYDTPEDLEKVHDFAVKWRDTFSETSEYFSAPIHNIMDECDALGFEMDCGHAFSEQYNHAVYEYKALSKIINEVTDIALLGSAIYSQLRYFSHWAYDPNTISTPENRAWFILILSRLAILSEKEPVIMEGDFEKIRIVSDKSLFGLRPRPNQEITQELTINMQGDVCFSGYNFGAGIEPYPKGRSKKLKIDKEDTYTVFRIISHYLSYKYKPIFADDVGLWFIEMTNTEGKIYKFEGSLYSGCGDELRDVSNRIRKAVGMPDLDVFDGNGRRDFITKIRLDYRRITTITPDEDAEDIEEGVITQKHVEHMTIDRKTKTLEHIQKIGTNGKISHKYEIEDGIENLLDKFEACNLFYYIEGNPDDVVDTPNDSKDYIIRIEYEHSPARTISGSYDKRGLPNDFNYFAETISEFIQSYGLGEILDPAVYGKPKRRKSDYIYCSVNFEENGKSYYYRTDDDKIKIGDLVLVPAGADNHKAIVKVIDINYFSEANVPLPLEKTKKIIRICTDDDWEYI